MLTIRYCIQYLQNRKCFQKATLMHLLYTNLEQFLRLGYPTAYNIYKMGSVFLRPLYFIQCLENWKCFHGNDALLHTIFTKWKCFKKATLMHLLFTNLEQFLRLGYPAAYNIYKMESVFLRLLYFIQCLENWKYFHVNDTLLHTIFTK